MDHTISVCFHVLPAAIVVYGDVVDFFQLIEQLEQAVLHTCPSNLPFAQHSIGCFSAFLFLYVQSTDIEPTCSFEGEFHKWVTFVYLRKIRLLRIGLVGSSSTGLALPGIAHTLVLDKHVT